MRTIIWRDIGRFFSGKVLILFLGCVLFGLSERQGVKLSYEQFILHMLSEHYYITYCMIPIFLLFTYKNLEDEMEYVLIRSRYYYRYFIAKSIAILLNMIGFVGIQVIGILLIGMGLSHGNSFDVLGGNQEVFLAYANHFSSPVGAIIGASSYMMIGLTVISILFLMLFHFFDKKMVSIVIILLYVLMTFGLKIPGLSEIPIIFMNNYILLFYNFKSSGTLIISLLSMFLILLVTAILIGVYWRKRLTCRFELNKQGMTFYYARYLFTKRNIIIILSVLLFISIWKLINVTTFKGATTQDFFISLFYGHGVNDFYMIGFLEMLILNGLPLYLFAIFIEVIHREQNLGLTIRMKYKRNWSNAVLRIGFLFINMYVILMLGSGIVLAMAANLSMEGMIGFLLEVSILKFLDILFQMFFFITLFTWKRNVTFAFIVVLGFNAMSLLPMTWVIYIPTGMSSLARSSLVLGEGGLSFQMAMIILGSLLCLGWVCIKFKGYKKVLGG